MSRQQSQTQLEESEPSQESVFVFDCGSNIGLSVRYFKYRLPNAKIVCFEPNEDTFLMLKKNTEKIEGVELHNIGLANEKGERVKEVEYFSNKKSIPKKKRDRFTGRGSAADAEGYRFLNKKNYYETLKRKKEEAKKPARPTRS